MAGYWNGFRLEAAARESAAFGEIEQLARDIAGRHIASASCSFRSSGDTER